MLLDAALAAGPLAALTVAARPALGLPSGYPTAVAATYLAMVVLLAARAPTSLPTPGMGWANRVTLLRAVLTMPVAGLLIVPGSVTGAPAWAAVLTAALALALDGADGAVARATETSTPFGARFDMELDAFLILALSGLVWTSTPLGPWVLGIGLLRYAFVALGLVIPRLRGALPASWRRKTICVVQSVALLLALAPATPVYAGRVAASGALVLLVYSFAVDVWWLLVRQPLEGFNRVP